MKESFVSKMLSILIVFAMLATAFVITTTLVPTTVKATTPGIDAWGKEVADLKYTTTEDYVTINTSGLTPNTDYKLYKPVYASGNASEPVQFYWEANAVRNSQSLEVIFNSSGSTATSNVKFALDRAGMWVLDTDSTHDGSNASNFASTVPGWIWVNSSRDYTITDIDDFKFGSASQKTITVTAPSADNYIWVDLLNKDTGSPVSGFHYNVDVTSGTGTLTFNVDGSLHNISAAGNYTVRAYKDIDALWTYTFPYYTYGYGTHNYTSVTGYAYDVVGPWDPPEKNATDVDFAVTIGEPTITATNITSVYWGYALKIEVNVTASNGTGITGGNISLANSSGTQTLWDMNPADLWINETTNGNYTIEIPRYVAGTGSVWETLGNFSWYIVFSKDGYNATSWENWNNSKRFSVTSSSPPVRLVITSDGDATTGSTTDNKVNVPAFAYTPYTVGTTNIDFTIYGRTVSGTRAYYGDDAWEDENNITLTGDILYPSDVSLTNNGGGSWQATVTPTEPGGSISISVYWPGSDNGSAGPEVINIVNGTIVTPSIESFVVGSTIDLTVKVTAKDIYGNENSDPYATVVLTWRGTTTKINITNGTGAAGNGLNGEYTFRITPADQLATAPQNITISAKATNGFWGYASVEMTKNKDLWVNCSPTTAYAGDRQEYDIDILVDGTTAPATYSDITVAVYKDGKLVTGTDAWSKTGSYQITDEEIPLSKGTYELYAYNNTHSSEGHNATITVTAYAVTCSPTVLAWLIDTETNITFQVTPTANGTLTLNNMSSAPNCSYVGQTNLIDITDGIGTLNEVDATDLGNVTFEFMPESGESREADGILRVTTATATPNPATIYINEPTNVVITVTHPATGEPIEDVTVGLDHGLDLNASVLSKLPTDEITDADGKVTFAVTSLASGDITIYINNETDPDNEFIITSAYRNTMTITVSAPSVNEGDTFTVYAKDASGNLITAEVSVLFNGVTTKTTTGSLDLTAPSVPTSLDYPIVATATGYTSDDTSIKVINKPTIYLSAPTEANAKESFTVSAGGDDGNSYGIIITITDSSGAVVTSGTTAGPSGLSFSLDKGTYTITATKEGYTPATSVTITVKEKTTPGFELLTLIIAIGVAFILLRRRRR